MTDLTQIPSSSQGLGEVYPDLPDRYLLIVGHGRSGTNMVLDLFDLHRNTLCRNEPNELRGTAFTGLGEPMFGDDMPEDFETRWCRAISAAASRNGDRDRFSRDKAYYRSSWRVMLGHALISRRRLRNIFLPHHDGMPVQEWELPAFFHDDGKHAGTLPVLKLLLTPAWVVKAHETCPEQRVIHVIRTPADFIQSWWSRYVQTVPGGPEQVFADNLPSLGPILSHFVKPNAGFETFSLHALVVSELWRWRYVNEILLDRLGASERYLHASYGAIMRDKVGWTETLYDFAGLSLNAATRGKVAGTKNTLFKQRASDQLDPALVQEAIEETLADSPHRSILEGCDIR